MSTSHARVERAAHRASVVKKSSGEPVGGHGDLVLPNIADFVLEPSYLGIERIYPRQLLVLKLVMAQPEQLTAHDHVVLAEWAAGFSLSDDGSCFEGGYGVTPDVLHRIERLSELGRPYFREAVMVLGRRASKNWLGAICGAYVIWRLMCTGDPQEHFQIDANKVLSIPVFAGQREQARAGQFRDLVERITSAKCFEPYIAEQTGSALRLWTPRQIAEGARETNATGLIEVIAREATPLAGRGPAAVALFMDEMAHMVNAGANRNAEEITTAAEPSLTQCKPEEFMYESSSPSSQEGRFYEKYLAGLALENGQPRSPDTIVFQLPSFDLYKDWELTHEGLEAYPGGPNLPRLDRALVVYDDAMRREDEANPETGAVEIWAQWRSSPNAYLARDQVLAIYAPIGDRVLTHQTRGTGQWRYVAHVDPSKSQANTGLVIAHLEPLNGEPHMVVDLSRVWCPGDFPKGIVDARVIVVELKQYLKAFRIEVLTFDQFNSAGAITELQEFVATAKLPVRTRVIERTATHDTNWRMAERFKNMVGEERVHAPHDPLAQAELLALVEKNGKVSHPTSGLVQTDDLADCYMNALESLQGTDYGHLFSQAQLHFSQQGGAPFGRDPALDALFSRGHTSPHAEPRGDRRGPEGGGRFRRGG